MTDAIVDEVRKVRDAHAARHNYDLDAIFRDIKDQEKSSGRTFVSFAPRRLEPGSAMQPNAAAVSMARDSKSLEVGPAAGL